MTSKLPLPMLDQTLLVGAAMEGNIMVLTYSDASVKRIDFGPWISAKLAPIQEVINKCPPAGTVLSSYCSNYDFYLVKATGAGGSYAEMIEHHSVTHCGYVLPPDGQFVRAYCSGFDLWHTVANGQDGTREVLIESNNQDACGYVPPVLDYSYLSPGTYYIPGVAGVDKATILLYGAAGGGGGGGKGGWDSDGDHGYGGPGGGGGQGGAGQRIAQTINFPAGSGLTLVVGSGGAAGAGSTTLIYDNSWHTGNPGAAGGAGEKTLVYATATGTLLAEAAEGLGGQGGAGGHIDDYERNIFGGNSGGGYPAGEPGSYVINSDGRSGAIYVDVEDATTLADMPTTLLGGAGGDAASGGGHGGEGGRGHEGNGSNGVAGASGSAIVRMNSTTPLGTSGPGFSGPVVSPNPGVSKVYVPPRVPQSCFVGDCMVLMANGTSKQICDIVIGEYVMGVDEQPVRVIDLYRPLLGNRPLVAFDNLKAATSAEHSMWAKAPDTGREWWATRDMEQWKFEALSGSGPDFDGNLPLDFTGDFTTSIEYGHRDGWKAHCTIKIDAPANTQLHHLILGGTQSYFVDGYLVSAMANLNSFDWLNFKMHG